MARPSLPDRAELDAIRAARAENSALACALLDADAGARLSDFLDACEDDDTRRLDSLIRLYSAEAGQC